MVCVCYYSNLKKNNYVVIFHTDEKSCFAGFFSTNQFFESKSQYIYRTYLFQMMRGKIGQDMTWTFQ